MLNLRKELSCLYADKSADEVYHWLKENGFLDVFKLMVNQLNKSLAREKELIKSCGLLPVGHIAACMLQQINSRLTSEKSSHRIEEMESTLGDICSVLLQSFLQKIGSNKKKVWMQISTALEDTCNLYQYDYQQMISFLKIDKTISLKQSHKNADVAVVNNGKAPSFIWKGTSQAQKEFLLTLREQRLIKSNKGLSQLFSSPTNSLRLSFDKRYSDLTLQYFYTLKKSRLLTFSGCRGFYQVLTYHVLDFQKDFLKNQDPRTRINALRQNKRSWAENQQRINRWLPCLP